MRSTDKLYTILPSRAKTIYCNTSFKACCN